MAIRKWAPWVVAPALVALVAALLISIAAVGGSAPPAGGDADDARFVSKTHDDLLLEVADEIPQFGGMYLSNDEGTLYVNVLSGSETTLDKSSVKEAIDDVFSSHAATGGIVELVPVDYTVVQLSGWYNQAMPTLFGTDGVVMTDLDERDNRIRVWVTGDVNVVGLTKTLTDMGIPERALSFTPGSEIQLATHRLTGDAPSTGLEGGYKIQASTGNECTLGYPVEKSGTAGFITAAHCTGSFGGVSGTKFQQPDYYADGDDIGTETIDPQFSDVPYGCPTGWLCRHTDAAFIELEPGVGYSKGKIARPVEKGSKVVDHDNSTFRIVRDTSIPTSGQMVNKVGQATGWTSGRVSNTCTNVSYGSDRKVLCQHVAGYTSSSGDSGAPVFRIVNSPSAGDLHLSGVHWASADGGKAIYSPVHKVHGELGTEDNWKSCASGFNC